MRRLLAISLLIAMAPGFAYGQAGVIALYVDPTYVDCDIMDFAPALVPVYVVHKLCPGATASRFMIAASGDFAMTHVGEIHHMPITLGDSRSGICMGYGVCQASDILLITVNYFAQGLSGTCSFLEVVADPTSQRGRIEMMDCAGTVLAAGGAKLYVNSDGSCYCWYSSTSGESSKSKPEDKIAAAPNDFCYPLPTQNGSWGQVKTLYR